MTTTLQSCDRTMTLENIAPLLKDYGLLIPFLREVVIDKAIESLECNDIETADADRQFCEQYQINTDSDRQTWLKQHYMTFEQLQNQLKRNIKIEKLKWQTWGKTLKSYFLQRKDELDQVIYSLIRTQDLGIAEELYFRLEAGEQTFSELAHLYSQGPEAEAGGLIGPVELGKHQPSFAQILRASQPKQIRPPIQLEHWIVIIQVNQFIPAQFDQATQQQLLDELFEVWIEEQIKLQFSLL